MRASSVIGCMITAFVYIPTAYSQQQEGCAGKLSEDSPVKDVIACIKQQQEQVEAIRNVNSSSKNSIPSGAVVAFAVDNCPSGWTVYDRTVGRTIIGSGQGQSLTSRPFLAQGGHEEYTLTIENLPPHRFSTNGTSAVNQPSGDRLNAGGRNYPVVVTGNTIETQSLGSGISFSIMPPFVAMLYCRKN